MRIIGGKHKGRKLISSKDLNLRPTADRVKESLFNIIQNDLADSCFLDLFAGTGSIGIEAISRGAKVTFCDNNIQSIKLIKANLDLVKEFAEVLRKDAFECLRYLYNKNQKYDFIFIDPPYQRDYEEEILQTLSKYPIMNRNAKIIIEHLTKKDFVFDQNYYKIINIKRYGDTQLTFYNFTELV
ncbi:MAG TPA: 16S rRNA (guanine(966)-N(2))-methyltransferase RsmD [Clostridiales bacterium]|jgi:16S rRNA (guanine(966)-N(2))-methyltransferase RsmD|nr:16S rRNA (guanine(966)-N(2))-methyltransferase RsmD [Clostridiales bacterium]